MSHTVKKGKKVIQVVLTSYSNEEHTVYPITRNLVDFFWGESYSNWARFKWTGKEWALWKKNASLPKGFINSLEEYRAKVEKEA
jgi:hypothetical protein